MEICSVVGAGWEAEDEIVPVHPPNPTNAKAKSMLKRIPEDDQRNLSLFLENSDSGLLMTRGLFASPLLQLDFGKREGNLFPGTVDRQSLCRNSEKER